MLWLLASAWAGPVLGVASTSEADPAAPAQLTDLDEDPGSAALELPTTRPHPERTPKPRLGTTGFRTMLVTGPGAVQTRVALVQDLDGAFISEGTLRAQVGSRWVSLAAEVAGTAAASGIWSGAGLGNVVIDGRVVFGGRTTYALGLRGAVPTGGGSRAVGGVSWWGTVPAATVRTAGLAIAFEGASGSIVWHVETGLQTEDWWPAGGGAGLVGVIAFDTSLATVQPLGAGWSLVGELEVVLAPSPLHVRALARRDLGGGWTIDAGLNVPVVSMFVDPTVQVIAGLRHEWPAGGGPGGG